MTGADEYYDLFTSGQYGRLYMLRGQHARGKTFEMWVLPKGEKVEARRYSSPPTNSGAVKVYGIIGGNPGWTESYGWLYGGPWQKDFEKMVADKKKVIADKIAKELRVKMIEEKTMKQKKLDLLFNYKEGDSV